MGEPSSNAVDLRVLSGATSAGTAALPSWEALYREHVTLVYRFVHARVGNRPDAEDITSDIFVRALPRLRETAGAAEIRGYLMTTARTVLADFWSRAYSLPAELIDAQPGRIAAVHEDASEPDDRVSRVRELLGRLPANHRAVLELRFLHGYSIRETAQALGLSVTNTKVIQWRALRRAAALDELAGP